MSDVCVICQKSLSSRMSAERADGSFECLSCAKTSLRHSMDLDREKINRALVTSFLAHDSNTKQDQLISKVEALPVAEVEVLPVAEVEELPITEVHVVVDNTVVDTTAADKKVEKGSEKKEQHAIKKESAVIGGLPLLKVEEVDLQSGSSSQAGRELAAVINKLGRERKTLMNKIKQLELTICSQQETIDELTADVATRNVKKESQDSSSMGVTAISNTSRQKPPSASTKANIRSIWEKSVSSRNRTKQKSQGSNIKRLESAKNMALAPLNSKGEQKGAAFVNGGRDVSSINKT